MAASALIGGFPLSVTIEQVKKYVEDIAGLNSVVALYIERCEVSRSSCATVQFQTEGSCNGFLSSCGFSFGRHRLFPSKSSKCIVKNPKIYCSIFKTAELHFGCMLEEDEFLSYYKQEHVRVYFESSKAKAELYFTHLDTNYRLDLNNLKKIYRRTDNFLIQLTPAPWIFKKVVSTGGASASSSLEYYRDVSRDMYVQTTDFTKRRCIGQASYLLLKVDKTDHAKLEENRMLDESNTVVKVSTGDPFNTGQHLVPIVAPTKGSLPFLIIFKVNMLVQNGVLLEPKLDVNFFNLLHKHDTFSIESALDKLVYSNTCLYDPVKWLMEELKESDCSKMPPSSSLWLDDGLVCTRNVEVTPCKVYFRGPEVHLSNRVLRMYPDEIDNFIRVSFVNENLEKLWSTCLSYSYRLGAVTEVGRTDIYNRIISTLQKGIDIGDNHFEFLAFSSSQLRECSIWMFASRPGLTAADIRARLGNFSPIKNVAKYAARLGQSLSASTETLIVRGEEMERVSDIETELESHNYVFSDGIGKISSDFAKEVAENLLLDSVPSAYQIRYAGYKGVVDISPTSTKKLSLRNSMYKFESKEEKLDVLEYSKIQPCYLNRQLISLFSTLGIRDDVFERKQDEAFSQLEHIMKDPQIAQNAL